MLSINSISSEGNFLLTLINFILDVNQLEYGTLSIESRLGKGSVFTVEIPLEPASPEQRSEILAPEHTEADRQQLKGKRVLLAEDNALNAEIATELMQSLELVVDWAENGAITAEKPESSVPNTYCAIFMDMQMPIMDGVEATRKIRSSHHADNGIPIIAMTANTFDADKKRCIDAGMNGYISKPIDSEAIIKALMKFKYSDKQ